MWDIGTRTQCNVDSQTYVGLDVIYQSSQRLQPVPAYAFPAKARAVAPVRSRIRARGWRSSASIVTSIPDRLIKVKFA